jgi:hypothetical protein
MSSRPRDGPATGAAVPGAIGTDTWTPIALRVRGAASSSTSQRTCAIGACRANAGSYGPRPCSNYVDVLDGSGISYSRVTLSYQLCIGRFRNIIFPCYSKLSVVHCSWTDASDGSDGLLMLFLAWLYNAAHAVRMCHWHDLIFLLPFD